MKVNKINLIIFITVIITAISLFCIKNNVRSINYELSEVKKQIEEEKDKIHLLKAEIAYLTSPQKLKKLTQNSLGLEKIKVGQLTADPLHLDKNISIPKITLSNNKDIILSPTVKWRFKKNPISRHVQSVLISKKR